MTNTEKAKKKRSPALVAGIILLLCTIILMITLAMFASFDEVTNRFGAKSLDIILKETKWDPGTAQNIVPGTVLDKNPRVYNNDETDAYIFLEVTVPYDDDLIVENSTDQKGAVVHNGEVPMYKFVVTDDKGTETADDDEDRFDQSFTGTQLVHSDWRLLGGYPTKDTAKKTLTYVYAHVYEENDNKMMALMQGHETRYPLFDKIRLVNFNEKKYDANRDYSVYVKAYGIQTGYLKPNNASTDIPEEVWEILTDNS